MQPVVTFTDVRAGSFALSEPAGTLTDRRRAVTSHPVSWLAQVHGAEVVHVDAPESSCGARGDALVTTLPGLALSVITADCAPVLLAAPGAVAAVHAGWRGLMAGVLERAVEALTDASGGPVTAWLGPCIRTRCYEFGAADLDAAVDAFGSRVVGETAWGTPALDMTTAVQVALGRLGVGDLIDSGVCTACSPVHWSHRAGRDTQRQASFIWLEP